ncbi:hypothetical protein EU537_01655 [Candidatus Thorarchaeota archaeon]|nr:MAG: hypothetical protein EU537_01655 [Candidatus Thorarchaeota archaeon]
MATQKKIDYQLGAILNIESHYPLDMWVVLPSHRGSSLKAAFLSEQESIYLRSGFHRCVIEPNTLASMAREAMRHHQKVPIALSRVQRETVLWMQDEDDAEWQVMGLLQYGRPPRGMAAPIRWIRLNRPHPDFMVTESRPERVTFPSDFNEQVNDLLTEIASYEVESEEVDCYITIDDKRDLYQVNHRSGDDSYSGIETSYTQEVIEYLRSPFRTGIFPSNEDGTTVVWDHLTDVEYPDVEIGTKDNPRTISMSFLKPFVHRSSFYPDVLSLPETCRSLLDMREGKDCTLVIREDKALAKHRIFDRFRVEFKGLEEYSSLKRLEQVTMHIFDVALLAECKQLVDTRAGEYHRVEIELGEIDFSQLPHLSEYERLDSLIEETILMAELGDDYGYENEPVSDEDAWGTDEDLVFLSSHIKVGRRGLVTIIARLGLESDKDNYDDIVIVENLSHHVHEGDVVSNSIWEEIDHRLGHLDISSVEIDRIYEEVEQIIEDRDLSLSDEEFY